MQFTVSMQCNVRRVLDMLSLFHLACYDKLYGVPTHKARFRSLPYLFDSTVSLFLSLVHTNQAMRCCDNNGFDLTPRYVHPSCMPIAVPSDDLHFKSKYVTCMEYTRSVTTYRGDCTFGAAEQVS